MRTRDIRRREDADLRQEVTRLRQQMFDLSLSARRQIDAVLTQEQRDKLKRG